MSVPKVGLILLVAFVPAAVAAPPVAVKTTSRNEQSPAAEGSWLAWAKSRAPSASPFDTWAQQAGAPAWKVNVRNTQAYPGGIFGTRLVYQEIRSPIHADIRLYDLERRRHVRLPAGVNTPRWECCPTLSGDWLLFTRGSAHTPQTQFVILRNLRTGERRTVARLRRGLLSSGQVAGDYAVWSSCSAPPRCVLVRYEISTARAAKLETGPYDVYAPSVNELGAVYYARSGRGCGKRVQLVRQALLSPPEVLLSLPAGRDIDVTYADLQPTKSGFPDRTHVYYDRITCRNDRSDLFRVDDVHILPR